MSKSPETHSQYAESRRMKIMVGVIVPLFSVLLGVAGSYLFNQFVNRIRVLDVHVTQSDRLWLRSELPEGGKRVPETDGAFAKFNSMRVTIYNDTDLDFEDIPARLYFLRKNGEHVRPVLGTLGTASELWDQAIAASTRPAKFEGIPIVFKVANRKKVFFDAEFYFEGSERPNFYAEVFKKGVDIRVDNHLGGHSIEYAVSPWVVMAYSATLTFVVGMASQLRYLWPRRR